MPMWPFLIPLAVVVYVLFEVVFAIALGRWLRRCRELDEQRLHYWRLVKRPTSIRAMMDGEE